MVKTGGTTNGATGVFVPKGYDTFTTPSDGNTYHNFTDGPIPAGLFGTGSNAYSGAVPLKGVPLPNQGGADTVIQRNEDVTTPGTTSLTVVGLSLASVSPLQITFADSHTEDWNMAVGLSQYQASTGSMTITDTSGSGGKFDSMLNIIPRFTFTRVSDGTVKVWDTGNTGRGAAPAGTLEASRQASLAQSASLIKPCIAVAQTENPTSRVQSVNQTSATSNPDATGGGAPIKLTSSGTPWSLSGGVFRPTPPSEEDRWRKHMPSPTPTPCQTPIGAQP
ncbi:MAG: hypothetical protein JO360_11935 [Acidobacteria bacterium]|nr:hypothetical protein [Acidobacteriota bacterium]